MSESTAISIGEAFQKEDVEISAHAPYFINFANPDDEMAAKYDPAKLTDGRNTVDGERIFYISNPALGLWSCDKPADAE